MAQSLICLCLFMLAQNLYCMSDAAISQFETNVPTSWKKIFTYHNFYSYPVTQTSQWTKGLKTHAQGKTLVVIQKLEPGVDVGQQIEIERLEFSYMDDSDNDHSDNYQPRHEEESMEQDEIYQQTTRQSRVTIPARTLLTKWQLVANVAGHEVGYDHTVDTYGNAMPHMHYSSYTTSLADSTDDEDHDHGNGHNRDHDHDRNHGHAVVLHNHEGDHDHDHDNSDHQPQLQVIQVQQQHHHGRHHHHHYHGHHHNDYSVATLTYTERDPIHYGTTKIRIRHEAAKQYLTASRSQSRTSPAVLGSNYDFQFILYKTRSGVKVRILKPVYRGYDYLTLDASGQVTFTRNSRSLTQYWILNQTTHLFDRDVVTFRNAESGRGFLGYNNGQVTTQMYRGNRNGDEWSLEAF